MKRLILTCIVVMLLNTGCGVLAPVAIFPIAFMAVVALSPPPECEKYVEESATMENQLTFTEETSKEIEVADVVRKL